MSAGRVILILTNSPRNQRRHGRIPPFPGYSKTSSPISAHTIDQLVRILPGHKSMPPLWQARSSRPGKRPST